MTNVNTITRLKSILVDINNEFYTEDWDGDDPETGAPIIRKVCLLDKQQELTLIQIKKEINEIIADIAESEEII